MAEQLGLTKALERVKSCLKCAGGKKPETDAEALLNQTQPKSSTQSSTRGGFTAQFELPYKREDIFKELTSKDQPLGLSSQNVNLTIERPGRLLNEPVCALCPAEGRRDPGSHSHLRSRLDHL